MRQWFLLVLIVLSLIIVIYGPDDMTFEKYANEVPIIIKYVQPNFLEFASFDTEFLEDDINTIGDFIARLWNIFVKTNGVVLSTLINVVLLFINCLMLVIPLIRG